MLFLKNWKKCSVMIISHKHKYVFLCLPRTGTTAIRKELCENYGGEEILYKHAPYNKFLQQASEAEKRYRVLASVRNPLDRTVSLYFKYKTRHDGIDRKQIKDYGDKNPLQETLLKGANRILNRRTNFVLEKNPSFAEYFLKFYTMPYSDWHSICFDRYDFLLRFESLAEDFEEAVRFLGMEPVRPLPVVNKTRKDDRSFEAYYTEEIRPRAQDVFWQAMQLYGYRFPEQWPAYEPPASNHLKYTAINSLRKLYWKYVR